jgi:hypothetical protein
MRKHTLPEDITAIEEHIGGRCLGFRGRSLILRALET